MRATKNITRALNKGVPTKEGTTQLYALVTPTFGALTFNKSHMITLRSNQGEAINKAIAYFNEKKPKPSLIVLPTAWGKSILTAYVARESNDKLLVLQPSKELLEQNYSKYVNLCGGWNAGIYSASFNKKEISQITYATIGSIKKLGKTFKELGFTKMLIDEAHLYPREADSMLGTFLQDSGITHVLGITATPIKLQQNYDIDGNTYSKLVMLTSRSKRGNFFKNIIHVGQISEMVCLGFWSPLRYEAREFDNTLLRYNSSKSEYTEASVDAAFEANGGLSNIVQVLEDNKDRKHILVFVPSVAYAEHLAQTYPDSAYVHGQQDKKERAHNIEDFKEGKIRVLFNVRVLSTGFDYTGIDCIILGISTASIALYYQIVGRATRIDPDKKNALIVDLGGNVERFGKVEDITFEKGTSVWRMFGNGDKLLSGIPITEIGHITREDTLRQDELRYQPIEIMPFGKHRGEKLGSIPLDYRRWMIRAFKWTAANNNLKQSILATIK